MVLYIGTGSTGFIDLNITTHFRSYKTSYSHKKNAENITGFVFFNNSYEKSNLKATVHVFLLN
jgi:hypothetical protein